eukprot:TRINITY_DN7023_c0_g4_i1.p1 TRINITY_DN7023_c0_g4~~TRINITY_DN7023_c0_g4_i1.p1  ORF type:complete len:126 (+),score=1.76 TRINITY_DN7023_c0_g4_i1:3-380(+)
MYSATSLDNLREKVVELVARRRRRELLYDVLDRMRQNCKDWKNAVGKLSRRCYTFSRRFYLARWKRNVNARSQKEGATRLLFKTLIVQRATTMRRVWSRLISTCNLSLEFSIQENYQTRLCLIGE